MLSLRSVVVAAACLAALGAAAAVTHGSHAATRVAAATIQRTFVSTSGSDANPCTATAPCRNFAAALALTSPGGEVVAVTSGGYGPVTIRHDRRRAGRSCSDHRRLRRRDRRGRGR
jgi:hypothetical protein